MELKWPLRATSFCLCVGSVLPLTCLGDVVDDSHLSLNFRNLYLNRNFTNSSAPVSKVGNWSQGFDLQFESGYTDTPLAVGFELNGQYALRLDSTGNDGSLPYSRHRQQAADDYSRGGATLKLKYAKTLVKIGDQKPFYPVASNDPSRQLDTVYQGAVVESRDIDNLTLVGGRFWSIVTRESSNHERLYRYGTSDSQDSDGLDFVGATYALTPDLQGSYFHGVLNDVYKQDYGGIKHTLTFADGYQLKTDVGYFNNREDGAARSGAVDNRAYFGLMTLEKSGHMVGVSYQRMTGDTVFPTLNGYVPQLWLPNWASLPFIRPDERSWSVRYGYNFAAMGLPGLKLFTRYIKGTDIDRGPGLARDRESERDIMLTYVIQSGPLKDLSFDLKNMRTQQTYGNDYNEYRLITSYTWKFW
ncbi:OprD family outer membrane porin [Pseudomonas putida]|uniref:Outer membrane porin, OprD family n=1 Tax=Pseudomonas putida TaxID=303 RepID=A0A7W2QLY0_PSEPU|nr:MULTISPECIES: OprD family outer membrane porin [Pseudomonas]MBA6119352.1 outer membrane porin, OprD family [Pseudomonas putida]MBI6945154.1 OprD family outer membrane porin [Pseudomonas putida]MBI6961037.1 OprD family outer membrane porin [Pseudomonas putida]MCZ9637449.1 OprD family porin [Pseudomonas putida]MEC4879040.1 OprD family porin [Pseudomonas sp. NC26]